MLLETATDAQAWDDFLSHQQFRPFLQSWTMGEVYRDIGQEPIRLVARDQGQIKGIVFGHIVPARRGRHLSIPYGPLVQNTQALHALLEGLRTVAKQHHCSFVRMSPFWPADHNFSHEHRVLRAPMHLLAEHLWYLPLSTPDAWHGSASSLTTVSADDVFKNFRATHRNLIRRAEKEGVTITRSTDPNADLEHFLRLHDETRKRHHFTPYSTAFFRSQVSRFAERNELSLYLAHYQNQVIATSIHMHAYGETSYHHGASSSAHYKIPASYLLQWTAIQDALVRQDHIYNFWGIAPSVIQLDGKVVSTPGHPFSGVTTFKTGFGGTLLDLTPCIDLPLSGRYRITRTFEQIRKWKRGF